MSLPSQNGGWHVAAMTPKPWSREPRYVPMMVDVKVKNGHRYT